MSQEQARNIIAQVRAASTVEEELTGLEHLDKLLRGNYPLLFRVFKDICNLSLKASTPLQIWICELFRKAFSNPNLPHQIAPVIPKMLDLISKFLDSSDDTVVLKGLYCSTSIFPSLFNLIVIQTQIETSIWARLENLIQIASAVNVVDNPNLGINVVKFLQTIILTLTSSEPDKPIVPANHPTLPQKIEELAIDYFHHLISLANLEGSSYLVVTALIDSLTTLLLKRPHISGDVINLLTTFYHSPPRHFTSFQIQQTLKAIRTQFITVMKRGSKQLSDQAASSLINLGESSEVSAHYTSLALPPPKGLLKEETRSPFCSTSSPAKRPRPNPELASSVTKKQVTSSIAATPQIERKVGQNSKLSAVFENKIPGSNFANVATPIFKKETLSSRPEQYSQDKRLQNNAKPVSITEVNKGNIRPKAVPPKDIKKISERSKPTMPSRGNADKSPMLSINKAVNIDASSCPPEVIADFVIHCLQSLAPSKMESAIEEARTNQLIEHAISNPSKRVIVDAPFITSLLASLNSTCVSSSKRPTSAKNETPISPQPLVLDKNKCIPEEIPKEEHQDFKEDVVSQDPQPNPEKVDISTVSKSFPLDAGQLQVLKLSTEETSVCKLDAFQRIVDSQSSYTSGADQSSTEEITVTWYQLTARLAAIEEDSTESIMFGASTVRGLIISFVLENFSAHMDLAVAWLYEEFLTSLPESREEGSTYTKCVFNLMEKYISQIPGKDTCLSELLLRLPHIPGICLKLIELLCIKPTRHAVGIIILREIADSRPSLRMTCLRHILEFSLNEEKKLRTSAIVCARQWFAECPKLTPHIESFARNGLQGLTELPVETSEKVDDKQATLRISLSAVAHLELFFAITSCAHTLVRDIFEIYPQVDGVVRGVIEREIAPLVRSIGPSSAPLLQHLCQFPAGAEDLAYRILQILMPPDRNDVTALKDILEVVKEAVKSDSLSVRFLVPILPFISEPEIAEFLPLVLESISKDDTQFAKEFFVKLASPWGPPPPLPPAPPAQLYGLAPVPPPQQLPIPPLMKPGKILLLLHCKDFDSQRTLVIKAVGLCISEVALFPASEVVESLQHLIELKKIPVLTMRTTIEFIRTHSAGQVVGRVVPQLLLRLVQKNVWTQPMLWEGFIRVCNMLGSSAHSILLKLPAPELEYVMDKFPNIKEALTTRVRAHLAQNPSLALQMTHLIPLFTASEKSTKFNDEDGEKGHESDRSTTKKSPDYNVRSKDHYSDSEPDMIYINERSRKYHTGSETGSSKLGSRETSYSPRA